MRVNFALALEILGVFHDPDVITIWNQFSSSTYDSSTDDDFGSIAAANYFTDGAAWFYYHQHLGDACRTKFRAQTSTNSGTLSFSTPFDLTSYFPTMRFDFGGTDRSRDGMGHYIGIDKFGIPGGAIQASWAQPIATTDPAGTSCQASTYSLAIFGSQVTP